MKKPSMDDAVPDAPGGMTAARLRYIADAICREWGFDGLARELRAHTDELEAREKAGVDAPVEGMLSAEERQAIRILVFGDARVYRVFDSHDACERALREAQASNKVLRRKIHIAERHNQMFERCESAWCHPSSDNDPAREALAQQPPQAGGEEKP